jgi:hypothetical protein
MAGPRQNAIVRRLDKLENLWHEFTEIPDARLCRWLANDAERRVIDVFVEVQNHESGTMPHLFIRFEEPFVDPARYGFVLLESLRKQYEEIREGIREEGIDANWRCPDASANEPDAAAFGRALGSLQAHYQSTVEKVVAVLAPDRVKSWKDFQGWLQRLVRSNLAAGLRVMVVDDLTGPAFEELQKAEDKLVKSIQADLDMPAAYLELARGTGPAGPGVAFRLGFLELTQAAGTGDVALIKAKAASALAIAQQQGWPQMQAVVQMTLGAALLGAKKGQEAVAAYRAAGSLMAAQPNDPAAPKLLLQGKLGEGATLFSDGKNLEAAKVYEEAAALADQQKDYLMCMESWRMASHCHEAAKQIEPSWRCGNRALDAAAKMEPELRGNSTLPFVGQALLRIASRGNKEHTDQVRSRMNQLAGPDWEKKLEAASKPV